MSAGNYRAQMKKEGMIRIVPGTPIEDVRTILSEFLGEYVTLSEHTEGGFCFCSGFIDKDEKGFYLANIPFLPGVDHRDIDLALSTGMDYTDGKPNGYRFKYAEIKPNSKSELSKTLRIAILAQQSRPVI